MLCGVGSMKIAAVAAKTHAVAGVSSGDWKPRASRTNARRGGCLFARGGGGRSDLAASSADPNAKWHKRTAEMGSPKVDMDACSKAVYT